MSSAPHVFLVGSGPGNPDLLTVKAARLIREADVVIYDRLVAPEIMALVNAEAELISVGKESKRHPVPQQRINELLIDYARTGRMIVRLKGGDPFIFGRGSEEAIALRRAGFTCEIVPGITAAQGCAASIGVPLTHRGFASGVRYVTGHCRQDLPLDLDWQGLADNETTLVVYMGAANIAEICDRLTECGLDRDTPVLAVNNGTTPRERHLRSTLCTLPDAVAAAEFTGPLLFIIGRVVSLYRDISMRPSLLEALNASAASEFAHV